MSVLDSRRKHTCAFTRAHAAAEQQLVAHRAEHAAAELVARHRDGALPANQQQQKPQQPTANTLYTSFYFSLH